MSKLIFERRKENQTNNRLSDLNQSDDDKDNSSFINKSNISEGVFNIKEEYNTNLKDIDEYKKEIDRIFLEKKEKLDGVFKFDGGETEDIEDILNQKYEEELDKEIKKEKSKMEEDYEKKKKKLEEQYKEKTEASKAKIKKEIIILIKMKKIKNKKKKVKKNKKNTRMNKKKKKKKKKKK